MINRKRKWGKPKELFTGQVQLWSCYHIHLWLYLLLNQGTSKEQTGDWHYADRMALRLKLILMIFSYLTTLSYQHTWQSEQKQRGFFLQLVFLGNWQCF